MLEALPCTIERAVSFPRKTPRRHRSARQPRANDANFSTTPATTAATPAYLGDLSDKISFRVCHLHSSATFPAALIQSRLAAAYQLRFAAALRSIAAAPL